MYDNDDDGNEEKQPYKKIVLYQLKILDILQVEKFCHGLRSMRTNLCVYFTYYTHTHTYTQNI